MHKNKLFLLLALAGLILLSGTGLMVQAASRSPTDDYAHIRTLVPPNGTRVFCEGKVTVVSAASQGQQKNDLSVTCDAVQLRLTFARSLVAMPEEGYAAYASLISPRSTLNYSQWIYAEPSQAAAAKARWRTYFQAEGKGAFDVTEQPGTLNLTGKDEFGLPWWGRIAQKGSRLVVTQVSALPQMSSAPPSPPEMGEWIRNLEPDNEVETRAFFEAVFQSIEGRFLAVP
jgi:hypothetical protein